MGTPSTDIGSLRSLTFSLHVPKVASEKVNELRYHLFCRRNGEIECHQLRMQRLPQEKRGRIIKLRLCILNENHQSPSPVGRGWKMVMNDSEQQLVVDWMVGQPPEVMLELVPYKCTKIMFYDFLCVREKQAQMYRHVPEIKPHVKRESRRKIDVT